VFFFVLPGVICVALVQKGHFGAEAPLTAKDTYTFMVTHLLPWGIKGLVTAAMLAAAMQTCSAALNSTATLFAYDIVKRYRASTTDHQLVVIGKITTVVATILAIICSPLFGYKDTVFQGLTDLICYISPPITAVFLLGVFWKRASGRAAYFTLVLGGVLGAAVFFLEWFKEYTHWNLTSMLASFYLCMLCGVFMIIASLVFPETLKEEARSLVWEDWREPLRGEAQGRGLGNYRVLTVVVLITFVMLYVVFR
jgi:SSS family solute:Na+ symporter